MASTTPATPATNSNRSSVGTQNSPRTPRTPRTPVQQAKPRMIINKMILNNFKSYFGKQEIGPFHKV